MKNVLFVGSLDGTACSLHYFTAFSRLGHAVLPFDPRTFETAHGVERAMMRLRKGPAPARVKRASERLVSICRESRFDLVFVMAENFIDAETIELARRASLRPLRFAYHSHDNNFSAGILKPPAFFETLRHYDAVFTTKSQNVARHKAIGVERTWYVPSAYEPTVHRPIPDSESRWNEGIDLGFVGTYDRSRDALCEAAGWTRLRVWGSHWRRFPGYAEHRDRIVARPLYYLEYADVVSHTKVSLGLLREEAEDRHTQRTLEIPACGSLQLAPRNEEILSFFDEGEEIACFGSPEELSDKAGYYLSHETERRRLARKGRERLVRGRHTYADRVATMIELALSESARPRPATSLSATISS